MPYTVARPMRPTADRIARLMGASPRRRMRPCSSLLLAIGLAIVAGLVLAATAGADAISPESGPTRERGQDIDTLYKIVFYTGLGGDRAGLGRALLLAVALPRPARASRRRRSAATRRSSWAGRWRPSADRLDHRPDHAHLPARHQEPARRPGRRRWPRRAARTRRIEPARRPRARRLRIKVSGQQYLWRYQYPNGAVSFQHMVVPKDTTVILDITANDVVHSWWIPKLGGKFDAHPGPHEQDLVQGHRDRHLRRPVRRVLRPQPRRT